MKLFCSGCCRRQEQVLDQRVEHTKQSRHRLLPLGPVERQQPSLPHHAGQDYESPQHEAARSKRPLVCLRFGIV